jgi:hypothetical protein
VSSSEGEGIPNSHPLQPYRVLDLIANVPIAPNGATARPEGAAATVSALEARPHRSDPALHQLEVPGEA